jgi:glycosyltransferase involved in cell wall biosynthesis
MRATPHRPLLERLGLQDKFVVQYSGNMGLWHDMDALVQAAHALRDDPRIHFVFIGKGRRRHAAQLLSQHLGLGNITWLDFLPPEQLAEGLSSCDVALISFRRGLEGVAVPSKLYGILASGRPVVAQVPRECEVGYTVAEEDCGLVVEPGDVTGLVEAIRTLAADPCLAERMGANAVSAYRSKYTIECAASAFKELWQLE